MAQPLALLMEKYSYLLNSFYWGRRWEKLDELVFRIKGVKNILVSIFLALVFVLFEFYSLFSVQDKVLFLSNLSLCGYFTLNSDVCKLCLAMNPASSWNRRLPYCRMPFLYPREVGSSGRWIPRIWALSLLPFFFILSIAYDLHVLLFLILAWYC